METDEYPTMDKRQQLIETAFRLFYQHGIHAVGVNQILDEAKVAKKTLYTHFESKEKLLEAVLDFRDARFVDWATQRMQQEDAGKAAILALFDALDDWFNDRVENLAAFHGCLFINTCSEYGDPSSTPHQLCRAHKRRIHELVKQELKTMAVAEADYLADMLTMLKEGAIVTAQVQGDKLAAKKAKRLAEQLLGTATIQ
jgi:AcrR family transcriptional regulator